MLYPLMVIVFFLRRIYIKLMSKQLIAANMERLFTVTCIGDLMEVNSRALDWREVALALCNLIVTLHDFLSKRVGSTKPWLPLPQLGTGYQTRVIGTFWDSPRRAASDSQRFKSCSSHNSDRTCNYLITWECGVRSGKFLIKCRTMTRLNYFNFDCKFERGVNFEGDKSQIRSLRSRCSAAAHNIWIYLKGVLSKETRICWR